uniref:Uncharacterized protein n=1 Tax=Homalodisca liturata TaxID=320908 RepID=A0A1B6I941_9HEMI
MSAGLANPDNMNVENAEGDEIKIAVSSIIDHNYSEPNMDVTETQNKRKRDQTENIYDPIEVISQNKLDNPVPEFSQNKKQHIVRLYNEWNVGPFEVIVQDKNKQKINPFRVGKIIQSHHTDVDFITRAGKNLVITCKSYLAANNIVTSVHLTQFNVFVPTTRIYTIGVAFVERDITEDEILQETKCEYPILDVQRLKKRVNGSLVDTSFVKITFETDKLPGVVYLNYVRMQIEPYIIPVKQCFRCFSYGHVMNSPCNKTRVCRDCGDNSFRRVLQAKKMCALLCPS